MKHTQPTQSSEPASPPGDVQSDGTRVARFKALTETYEAAGADGSVSAAGRAPQRYVLMSENASRGRHLSFCATIDDVHGAACERALNGWQPVCFFDLDHLGGTESPISEGELVRYQGQELFVAHVNVSAQDGEPYQQLWLDSRRDRPLDACAHVEVDEAEVQRADAVDRREPLRFNVAAVRAFVAFNNLPCP